MSDLEMPTSLFLFWGRRREREREGEKNNKKLLTCATVNFQIRKFTVAYLEKNVILQICWRKQNAKFN